MPDKTTRDWSERVREVQDLLRRFKLIRARLDRAPKAGRHGVGERVGLEREARSLHSRMVRSARGLIADAGGLSPRRVHFDADQKEPGALRTHESAAKGRLDWSMAFGPSALSRSGKVKTISVVDRLRRRLAGERRSFKDQHAVPAHEELIDLAQRWSWLPNLEHLDRWSEEFLARFDRSLAWFGVDLAQRFEPAPHDGSPDLIFEEPWLGAIAGGGAAGAATGFPAFGGSSASTPAAMGGSSVAAGGGFAVGGGMPSVGGVASSSGPAPVSGLPHVTAGASAVGGGATRAASLPSIPPIGGVRSPGWSAGAAAHPVGRTTGWPTPPIVSPRGQFVPHWLGGAPIPSDVTRRRDHEPFKWPQPVSAPGLAWPSVSRRSSAPQLGATPTTSPRTTAAAPWGPSHSTPAVSVTEPTRGGLGRSIPQRHPAWGDARGGGAAPGSAVAGPHVGLGATPSAARSRSARVGHPRRARVPAPSSSAAPSPPSFEALAPGGMSALGQQIGAGRARKVRPGASPVSAPGTAHIVPAGAALTPGHAAHAAAGLKMFEPAVPAKIGSHRAAPRRGWLPSLFPVHAASAGAPFNALDRFLDAPQGAPAAATRPLRSPWGASPAQQFARRVAADLGGDSSASGDVSRPARRGVPLPGILHETPSPKVLRGITPGLAEVRTPHVGLRTPRGIHVGELPKTPKAMGIHGSVPMKSALPLLLPTPHAPTATSRWPAGLRDSHFVPMIQPTLGGFGKRAATALRAGLPSFADGAAHQPWTGPATRLSRPMLPGLIAAHAAEPLARGTSAVAHPPVRFAPAAAAAGPRGADHHWLATPEIAAPGRPHVRPESPVLRPNADVSSRAGLMPLVSSVTHEAPAGSMIRRPVSHALDASPVDAASAPVVSPHSAGRRGTHPSVPSAATTPAWPWRRPETLAAAPSLGPLAATAGYAGPGPRAFPPAISTHHAMVGATAAGRVASTDFWDADRFFARPPLAHRASPMLQGLLSGVPSRALQIPGLGRRWLSIPNLGTLSAAPEAAEQHHHAAFAVSGAPTWPGHLFDVKPGAHARSPEMSYVILGSRHRGPSVEQRAPRTITETRFIEEPHDHERERGGATRILKASVGRDHRPQPSGAAGVAQHADETRQGAINPPDLDRLAVQIYGRIKHRLAIDRERRGFVR